MARTDENKVAGILSFTTDDISSFISIANRLVTREVEPHTSMDSDGLTELETWLAAHFVSVKEGVVTRENVSGTGGGVSQSYAKPVDQYLSATIYGQQAMLLDDTGRLRQLNEKGSSVVSLDSIRTYDKSPGRTYG